MTVMAQFCMRVILLKDRMFALPGHPSMQRLIIYNCCKHFRDFNCLIRLWNALKLQNVGLIRLTASPQTTPNLPVLFPCPLFVSTR